MRNLKGKVAAVTGAASGIGRALALRLADEGSRVALADRDEDGLEETREQLAVRGHECTIRALDVADKDAVFGWADQVVKDHGAAHLIFNNAGVALAASVRNTTLEELEWVMAIDFWGVVYGTTAFLPHFERAGEGHIVYLSSVFGLIAAPGNGAYNAAKFAVRGYTEALSIELQAERSPIVATTVHPGGIKTSIARSARVGSKEALDLDADGMDEQFQRAARTSPDRAAEVILDGVKKDKRRILIGGDARVISGVQRLLPTLYQRVLARATRRSWAERDKSGS